MIAIGKICFDFVFSMLEAFDLLERGTGSMFDRQNGTSARLWEHQLQQRLNLKLPHRQALTMSVPRSRILDLMKVKPHTAYMLCIYCNRSEADITRSNVESFPRPSTPKEFGLVTRSCDNVYGDLHSQHIIREGWRLLRIYRRRSLSSRW